jgi:transcriptional repressor NrdR
MVCVHCGGKTKVVNSRQQHKSNQVWRRRQCLKCGAVFSTREAAQHELAWLVRDGSRLEPFSRDTLFLSLYKSCGHRPTALSDARGLTDTIIGKLPAHMVDGAVASQAIARVALVALNRFDTAASTHYQAFHS